MLKPEGLGLKSHLSLNGIPLSSVDTSGWNYSEYVCRKKNLPKVVLVSSYSSNSHTAGFLSFLG